MVFEEAFLGIMVQAGMAGAFILYLIWKSRTTDVEFVKAIQANTVATNALTEIVKMVNVENKDAHQRLFDELARVRTLRSRPITIKA